MRFLPSTLGLLGGATLGVVLSLSFPASATRNSVGTYSLPGGNPVVSGTTISSTWANNTLGDLAAEMTNSLDRQGRGPMLAPLKLQSGTAGAPGLTFNGDTDTGIYRAGNGDVRMQVDGAQSMQFTPTGTFTPGVSTAGTLVVNGVANVAGNTAISGTLSVTGNTSLTGLSVSGASTFAQPATLNSGGPALILKPGSADHVYTEYYADTQAPNTRSGFTGYSSAGASDFSVTNTMAGGNLLLSTPGQIVANSAIQLGGTTPASSTAFSNTVTRRNIVKAWGMVRPTGGGSTSATIVDGFNVTTAAVTGVQLNVALASAMADSSYAVIVSTESSGYNCSGVAMTPTTLRIGCRDISGTTLPFPLYNFEAGFSSAAFNFVVLGAQ